MSVYKKLLDVQKRLNVPKNQRNEFGKYNYRTCEDILSAVKPLLAEVNATLVVTDELVLQGDWHYIKATATFIDCEEEKSVSNTAYAREGQEKKGMDVSQVTGSTSSYARKYALNGLFCIDDEKDADYRVSYMDEEKLEVLKKELVRTKTSLKSWLANYGCKMVTELSKVQYDDVMFKLGLLPDYVDLSVINKEGVSPKVTQAMINTIQSLIKKYTDKGIKIEKILKMYQLENIEDMNIEQFKHCVNQLSRYEEEKIS